MMKLYLSSILISNFLLAHNLQFTPEFKYWYDSDSKQVFQQNQLMHDFEILLIGKYDFKKIHLLTRMGYHLIDGKIDEISDFNRTQGLQHVEHPPGLKDNQGNYYIGDMNLFYGDSTLNFFINKWDKHWGPGITSLTISKNIPSFFHFGFNWKLSSNFQFEYFHGKLKSEIHDNTVSEYYDNFSFDVIRNIVGHRLSWRIGDKFILSGNELVVYADRIIEMTYLLPFVPFFPLQGYVGESDNVLLSGEIEYLPNNNTKLYVVLLIDEWTPPKTFKKDNHNWFGWQFGLKTFNFLLTGSILNVEHTWTDHRIYRHRFNVNDYYSYGNSVGFWAGPHSQEFYADYSFSILGNKAKLLYSLAQRGELTDLMLEEQYCFPNNCSEEIQSPYERFSGMVESKEVLQFSLERKISKKIKFLINYSNVSWENSGSKINPSTSELIINSSSDVIKNSLDFSIQYTY